MGSELPPTKDKFWQLVEKHIWNFLLDLVGGREDLAEAGIRGYLKRLGVTQEQDELVTKMSRPELITSLVAFVADAPDMHFEHLQRCFSDAYQKYISQEQQAPKAAAVAVPA